MAYPEDGFLPGWEQIDNPNVARSGYETNGPARIMCHMTVSRGISPSYIAIHRVPPQLWANPYDGRRYQTGSLNLPGKALYQPQWGSDDAWTNKHGWTIQIEIIGVPWVNVKTYTDEQDKWIGENVIADVIKFFRDRGIPYDETAFRIHDDTSGSASTSYPGRMGMEESIRTGGMVAHIDEWENDHWDCSVERLDIWLYHAKRKLGIPTPILSEDDEMMALVIQKGSAPGSKLIHGDGTHWAIWHEKAWPIASAYTVHVMQAHGQLMTVDQMRARGFTYETDGVTIQNVYQVQEIIENPADVTYGRI